VLKDWDASTAPVELADIHAHGGRVMTCENPFFGRGKYFYCGWSVETGLCGAYSPMLYPYHYAAYMAAHPRGWKVQSRLADRLQALMKEYDFQLPREIQPKRDGYIVREDVLIISVSLGL
jgi:hypothetical protein